MNTKTLKRYETESNIRERIFAYLKSASSRDEVIKIPRVADHCGVSKHVAREFSAEYSESVLESLLLQEIKCLDEFKSWCQIFNSFRSQLERKVRYQMVRSKHIEYAIHYLNLSGRLTVFNLVEIVGGESRQCRESIRQWEMQTGLESNSRRSWKQKLKRWDPSDKSDTKTAIFDYIDECRKNRVAIHMDNLVKFSKRSKPAISATIRPYIDEVAKYLAGKFVSNRKDMEEWNSEYDLFKNFFSNITRYENIRARRLRLAIEYVKREYGCVSYTEVVRFTGTATSQVNKAIKIWEAETGEIVVKLKAWRKVTLEMLLAVISPELKFIPLTFMDPDAGKELFADRHIRAIFHIPQPHLRSVAFFILSFSDTNRANDINFFKTLSNALLQTRIPDITSMVADKFFNDYFMGSIAPDDSKAKRVTMVQSYFRLLKCEETYFRSLSPEQRVQFEKFRLPAIKDTYFWTHADPQSSIREETKSRRKQKTDVIHDKFYVLRNISERRSLQMERLNLAYAAVIEQHKVGEIELPYHFSVADESINEYGKIIEVQQKFSLWDLKSLVKVHSRVNPDYYKNATLAQQNVFNGANEYFLHYDGGTTSSAISLNYWFIQEDFGVARRLPKLFEGIPGGYDWGLATRSWHCHVHSDLSTRFMPIETLRRALLIGNAAIQIMTKTGARMNEFLQVRLTAEKLCRVSLGGGKDTIAFWAIPKGRKEEEPYYIDEKCMQALHSWWSYAREKGNSFDIVPPTRALDAKLEPANYLWQASNRHLSHSDINVCIRFLWADVQFVTSEGDAFDVTSHLLRHSFATELRALDTPLDVLGMLMKQRDVKVTDYYSKPPPTILADMQRRIFESRIDLTKSHMRTAGEMRRQIDEAKEKVGALIPIVGGTCTVANECPAKYACMGCAGNVPDPLKRVQVIDLKSAYQAVAMFARKSGLPAEIRKAEQVINSCDEIMLEMDLIEATEKSALSPLHITPRKN